jgi:hypothetical protein
MQLPIIVSEHGDLMVFRNEQELSSYLEPIDVKNGEYRAYDAKGRLLSLDVAAEEERSWFLGRTVRERVRLQGGLGEDRSLELKEVIEGYLRKIDVIDSSQDRSLDQLIELLTEKLLGQQ